MSSLIDSAEDDLPTPDTAFYKGNVQIPGVGEPPNRCRGLTPVGFCESGHVRLGRSSCETRYCPDHWRGWVRNGTVSAVGRLAAFREAAEGWGKRLLHVVASPDVDRVSADLFWGSLRSDAQDAMKAVGARGGYMVAHPYRTSDRADRLFATAVEHGNWEKSRGRWSFLRDWAGGEWSEWEALVEEGPHYHGLVACEDFDPDGVPDGWVVKNVRSFSPFRKRDMEAFEDMAKAVYYLRTHAGAQDNRQSASWFGEMHPASFDPKEELGKAEWFFMQERAAEAVAMPVDGEDAEVLCEIDDCGAVVHDIEDLPTFLASSSWVHSLPPKRRHRLRAVQIWIFEETVKPPPSVRSSEHRTREWLLETGRMYATSKQTGLGAFGAEL